MLALSPAVCAAWIAARGWSPRPHPFAMCDAARAGDSVLVIAAATDAAPPEPAPQARQVPARQGIAHRGSLFGALFPA
ncbi:MAG: hypothetical protein HIU82_15030 [Proteobacteria bacterium]|nr:hypothetical protein [Pseudomonadota bacterium]